MHEALRSCARHSASQKQSLRAQARLHDQLSAIARSRQLTHDKFGLLRRPVCDRLISGHLGHTDHFSVKWSTARFEGVKSMPRSRAGRAIPGKLTSGSQATQAAAPQATSGRADVPQAATCAPVSTLPGSALPVRNLPVADYDAI